MRAGVIDDIVSKHIPHDAYPEAWDIAGLKAEVVGQAQSRPSRRRLGEGRRHRRRGNGRAPAQGGRRRLRRARERNSPEAMRYVEKQVILQSLDHLWRDHLVTLDHLRQVIGWRGMAQRDPLNEYKSEAFDLFRQLIAQWHEAVIAQMMRVEVRFQAPEPRAAADAVPAPRPATGLTRRPSATSPSRSTPGLLRRRSQRVAAPRASPSPSAIPTIPDLGQGRPQRGLPLRIGQEVQALPRGAGLTGGAGVGASTTRAEARAALARRFRRGGPRDAGARGGAARSRPRAGLRAVDLIAAPDAPLGEGRRAVEAFAARREAGEPLSRILGRRDSGA